MSGQKQFLAGVRAGIPVVLGFIPVGIAYAIMAREAGLGILQTSMLSLTVFAGASQMMAVGMYAQGAGVLAIVLATFIINLRHIIMSTCVFNRMQSGNIATRLSLSFGVTDESFAIFTTERVENCTPAFFLGLILSTWGAWNVGTLIGAVLSDLLPTILTAALGISLYAMFLSLLLPGLRGNLRLSLLVLLTAICNYLLSLFLEPSWALVISTLACAFLGVFFVDLETGEEVRDE